MKKTWIPIVLLAFSIENVNAGKKTIDAIEIAKLSSLMDKIDQNQDLSEPEVEQICTFFNKNIFEGSKAVNLTSAALDEFLIKRPERLLSNVFGGNVTTQGMNNYFVCFRKIFQELARRDQETFFPFIVDLFNDKDEAGQGDIANGLVAFEYLTFVKNLTKYLKQLSGKQNTASNNASSHNTSSHLKELKGALNALTFVKFFMKDLGRHFSREVRSRRELSPEQAYQETLSHMQEDNELFEKLLMGQKKTSEQESSLEKPVTEQDLLKLPPVKAIKFIQNNPVHTVGTLDRFAQLAHEIVMPKGLVEDIHSIDAFVDEFYGYVSAISKNDGVEPIISLAGGKVDEVFNEIKEKFSFMEHRNIVFSLQNIEYKGISDGIVKDAGPNKKHYDIPFQRAIDQFKANLFYDVGKVPQQLTKYVEAVNTLNIAMKIIDSLPEDFQQALNKDFVQALAPVIPDSHEGHLEAMSNGQGLCGPGYLDRIIRGLAVLFIEIRIIKDPLITVENIENNKNLKELDGLDGNKWRRLIQQRNQTYSKEFQ